MNEATKTSLRGKLPMALPKDRFACPICGATVHLTGVDEWGADDGEIAQADFGCETEPDIDSDEWWDWFNGHHSMPYVDWLPYETRLIRWLNRRYHYLDPQTSETSEVQP